MRTATSSRNAETSADLPAPASPPTSASVPDSRSDVLEVRRQRRELRLALDQVHDRDGRKRYELRSMDCAQYAGCGPAM